jgi:branched-chain amino acid transport system substrate-binding protein
MRNTCFRLIVFMLLAVPSWAQSSDTGQAKPASPPAERYANMPDEAVPYRRFTKPYYDWFVRDDTLQYSGAADRRPDGDLSKLKEVAIGFFSPVENNPEMIFGIPALHGAQLALEQANARGGFHGKPYALKLHNESALWGASSAELVKMLFDENCWGMVGCIDGQNCHIVLRTTLKLEVPIVDIGTTDPTVTETRIQWLLHNFTDDRQQGYTLADYVFKNLKLKRIGVLRANARYGRIGVVKFNDEARRMGHQPVLEVKYERGDQDFSSQLRMLRDAKVEGVVIWGEAEDGGHILKQMRAMGMNQPVFGGSRLAYPQLLAIAGPAAEGLVVTSALDPTRTDPKWLAFRDAYRQKFHEEPIDYAAYDGINILIAAIEKAGLNRGRIMDVLRDYQMKTYAGVTGTDYFDYTLNNLAPVTLARVKDGKFEYWRAPRQRGHEGPTSALTPAPHAAAPYATINRHAVSYNGPGREVGHDLAGAEIRIGLLAPLAGPRRAEGEELRRAAQMAIEQESAISLGGCPLTLATRDESGPWGQASAEIVNLIFKDRAVALITSAEGGYAHLAEQVANKIGVPILTLSTDPTTTEINLPWLFRLGPTDAAQARAFARDIYRKRGLERVVLVAEDDHDGRVGGEEFEKVAREMNAPILKRITIEPGKLPPEGFVEELRNAQAVVIWTDAGTANLLIERVRATLPFAPLYLCRKATQRDSTILHQPFCDACGGREAGTWTASAPENQAAYRDFEQRYRRRFGVEPGTGAAETYDAVGLLAASLRQAGPNRARLRDALAGVSGYAGASGVISFDHAGNDLTAIALTRLP